MNSEDFDHEFGENEEERLRRERQEFFNEYFSIRAKMEKLEKEEKIYNVIREKFVKRLMLEVQALSVDFYPEFEPRFPVIYEDLHFQAESVFDDVVNLCDHYIEEKTDYYRQLHQANFEFTTSLDLFSKKVEIASHHAIMDIAQERFEKEYVEGFYFECYLKHIHLLLKRLFPEFVSEIYALPAQGYRELDGFLYIAMIDLFDLIREASEVENVF
jgi:hypothetical protein